MAMVLLLHCYHNVNINVISKTQGYLEVKKIFCRFANVLTNKKLVALIFLACVILVGFFITLFYINNLNDKNISPKLENVQPDSNSRISKTTKTIYIKEWKIKAQINGKILGDVTYSVSDNGTRLNLRSSKLDNTDLSSNECRSYDVNKNSWSIVRNIKKNSYSARSKPYIIGNYEYQAYFPANICSEVIDIDAAFNYLLIHLAEGL